MASNLSLAANTAKVMLNAITTIASAGYIEIFSGTQPASSDTGITTQVELVSLPLNSTAFGTPASGQMSAGAITPATAIATGTASWFRMYETDGTTAIMDGSVGTSGCDLNLVSTTITSGDIIGVTSFTITLPLT
jgi:hypothetical protein